MSKYVDIAVNLTASSFEKDVPRVIERAQSAGVEKLIVTGTDSLHSEQALLLAEQYESICYATIGLHPHNASDYSSSLGSELRDMLRHKNAVAVGECGLDYNRNFSTRKEQVHAFEAQLEMAIDLQKPLFLHQRDAHDDFLSILKSCRGNLGKVVVHCFTGSIEEVNEYVLLDMHVGVTGWICDERRGGALQQAVKHIPLDKIMLETDAPYLLPRNLTQTPVEKRRNEPCFLPHVSQAVAKYMQVNEVALAATAYDNSCAFFDLI